MPILTVDATDCHHDSIGHCGGMEIFTSWFYIATAGIVLQSGAGGTLNTCFRASQLKLSTKCIATTTAFPRDRISVVSISNDTSICQTCGGSLVTEISNLDKCIVQSQKKINTESTWTNEGFNNTDQENPSYVTQCSYNANIVEILPGNNYCIDLTGANCNEHISKILNHSTSCTTGGNFTLTYRKCSDVPSDGITTASASTTVEDHTDLTTHHGSAIQTTATSFTEVSQETGPTAIKTTRTSTETPSTSIETITTSTETPSTSIETTPASTKTHPTLTEITPTSTKAPPTSTGMTPTSTERTMTETFTQTSTETTLISEGTTQTPAEVTHPSTEAAQTLGEITNSTNTTHIWTKTAQAATKTIPTLTETTTQTSTETIVTSREIIQTSAEVARTSPEITHTWIETTRTDVQGTKKTLGPVIITSSGAITTSGKRATANNQKESGSSSVLPTEVNSTNAAATSTTDTTTAETTSISSIHRVNSILALYPNFTTVEETDRTKITRNSSSGFRDVTVNFSGVALLDIHGIGSNASGNYILEVVQLRVPYDVYDLILNRSEHLVGTPLTSSQTKTLYLAPTNTPFISISLFYENGTIPAAVTYSLDVSNDTALLDKFGSDLCDGEFGDTTIILDTSYVCAYINPDTGQFSSDGCATGSQANSEVTCSCSHTTVFAVLLSVNVVILPVGVKICSYIVESLSVIFLGITAAILIRLRKKIRGDRTTVQINLAISLLLLHLVSLMHDKALPTTELCEITAVLTHLLLLTSAMWMLLEGVTLLTKTLDSALRFSENRGKMVTLLRLSTGWLIPMIITMVAFIVGKIDDSYLSPSLLYQKGKSTGDTTFACDSHNDSARTTVDIPKYDVCWVSNAHFMLQGAVFVPLGIIFAVNIAICIRVGTFVYQMTVKAEDFRPTQERQSEGDHVNAALKAVLLLFPVLGVPWVIGYFTGIGDRGTSIIFMYANAVINGLQGLLLFLLYCVVSVEVRTAFLNSWARGKVNISAYIDISKRKMSVFSTTVNVRLQGTAEGNSATTEYESHQF